jgi:hypothetical protein
MNVPKECQIFLLLIEKWIDFGMDRNTSYMFYFLEFNIMLITYAPVINKITLHLPPIECDQSNQKTIIIKSILVLRSESASQFRGPP